MTDDYVSCRVYFLGLFFAFETATYPLRSPNDMDSWRKEFRKWVRPWARWLCSYRMVVWKWDVKRLGE